MESFKPHLKDAEAATQQWVKAGRETVGLDQHQLPVHVLSPSFTLHRLSA